MLEEIAKIYIKHYDCYAQLRLIWGKKAHIQAYDIKY